jgi:hypothetical protein
MEHQQGHVVVRFVERRQFRIEVTTDLGEDRVEIGWRPFAKHVSTVFGDKNQWTCTIRPLMVVDVILTYRYRVKDAAGSTRRALRA